MFKHSQSTDQDLYRYEERALARAEVALARASAQGDPLYAELDELCTSYRRILRHFKHLVRLSDAQQANLSELNETLERRNQMIKDTFGRFTSEQVVDEVLSSPHGIDLKGKRRRITMLMSDLRGFTSLCDRISAEDSLEMINAYLEEMTEVIFRQEGTILGFVGDAIFAIFGAPLDVPDHASRAVACAVQMQQGMESVNAFNRKRGFPPMAMGIGINTGEVVVGHIGSSRRVQFGVAGSQVNITSRIESFTVGGQILASEATVRACGPILRVDRRLEIEGKGLGEPLEVCDLGGIAGDYNLFTPRQSPDLRPLPRPMKVEIRPLLGKGFADESMIGRLLSLSPVAANLEVAPGSTLNPGSDIRLRLQDEPGHPIPGDIYAKVTDRNASLCGIVLTSIPPESAAVIQYIYGLTQGIEKTGGSVADTEL